MPTAKKSKQEDQRIGLVLVGTGRIGTIHFQNIQASENFRLLYVVDIVESAAKKLCENYPHIKTTTKLEEALDDAQVDAVLVCSPTATHLEVIDKSFKAKKAVMCEKPISLKVEDIDQVYKWSQDSGMPILCAYQRRFDPSFAKVIEQCHSGKIGQVQVIKSISRDHPVPSVNFLKISGGIFHDCASHDIDMVCEIAQEQPLSVFSIASCFREEIKNLNDFDTVLIGLQFQKKIGIIELSRKAAYGYDQRLEVLGDQGMSQAENIRPTSVILSTAEGVQADPYHYSFPQRYPGTYRAELEHFAKVVRGEEKPRLTHQAVRQVAIIADAAEEAARTGKTIPLKF